ncbi:MAG: hypothetical protein E3J72_22855, partial [Planctomycetota bacterium]
MQNRIPRLALYLSMLLAASLLFGVGCTKKKKKYRIGFGTGTPTFTIVATADAGGIINPSGNVPVIQGDNQSFVITPDTGYYVADVLVGGVSVGAVTGYEFVNVTADDSIAATFANDYGWFDVSPGGTEG